MSEYNKPGDQAADDEYASHSDLMATVAPLIALRAEQVSHDLIAALSTAVISRQTAVIKLGSLPVDELASLFRERPRLFKPILACANVAARAIHRDLGIPGVNTYAPRLTAEQALAIAAYVKPFLPQEISSDALLVLDKYCYIDKEIRAGKGRWEEEVTKALVDESGREFKKRRLVSPLDGRPFEIDAAHPPVGPVLIGIDVKRVEAARDVQKRAEEIAGHAQKLRAHNSQARFAAVLYIPKLEWQVAMRTRLADPAIDIVVFAGRDSASITRAVANIIAAFDL